MQSSKKTATLNYQILGPKQQQFHDSTAKITIAIGGIGSGKTHSMIAELLSHLLENPAGRGRKALVIARTHDHAKKQILKIIRVILTTARTSKGRPAGFQEGRDFKVNLASPITVSLPFGSEITIWSVEGGKSIKGLNVSYLAVDEVTDFEEEYFDDACNRAAREVIPNSNPIAYYPGRIWAVGNPKNKYHWLYKRWFEAYEAAGDTNTIPGVHVLYIGTFDNPANEANREMLEQSVSSPLDRQRRLEGRFVNQDGLCLSSWDADTHTFDRKTTTIAPDWQCFGGLDFGEKDPTALVRVARDKEGRLWVYHEYYERQKTISQHCKAILRPNFPGEKLRKIYSDTHLETVSTYRENGVTNIEPVKKGPGSVVAGIAILNQLLQDGKLRIATDCKNLITEIETYEWKSTSAKEVPKPGYGDHCIDALRYLATSLQQRGSSVILSTAMMPKKRAVIAADPRPIFTHTKDGKPVYLDAA